MSKNFSIFFFFLIVFGLFKNDILAQDSQPPLPEDGLRVMQLMKNPNGVRRYPDALPSLLTMMNEQTWAKFDTDPRLISERTDERLFENTILYYICEDRCKLEFNAEENQALRRYMELGGFVYLDAGIKASFWVLTWAIVMRPGKSVQKLENGLRMFFPKRPSFPWTGVMICFGSSLKDSLKILILKLNLPRKGCRRRF